MKNLRKLKARMPNEHITFNDIAMAFYFDMQELQKVHDDVDKALRNKIKKRQSEEMIDKFKNTPPHE